MKPANPPPAQLLPVVQADRDAAAAFYGPHLSRPGEVLVTAHMRAGQIDESPLIQAFAAHRIAHAPERGELASLVEALRSARDSVNDIATGQARYTMSSPKAARSLRELAADDLKQIDAALQALSAATVGERL